MYNIISNSSCKEVLSRILLFLVVPLLLTGCKSNFNSVIPAPTTYYYDVVYTKPNGDTVNTWLTMNVGKHNIFSSITGTTGIEYKGQDFITKDYQESETIAYIDEDVTDLHPPRLGSYYFTEALTFPYSCSNCLIGTKISGYIQVKKDYKEMSFLRIERELELVDTTLYVFKGDTVKCMLWKGKNTNHIEKIGQYMVEYVFSPKYAFLEWRYFLPDSSKVVLKLRDIERVK